MASEGWWDGHLLAPSDWAVQAMLRSRCGTDSSGSTEEAFDPPWTKFKLALRLLPVTPSSRQRHARGARGGTQRAHVRKASSPGHRRGGARCSRVVASRRVMWLAAIDPAYPADYARGIASYRRGDYGSSAASFRLWLRDHPEGPYALRALNYQKTSPVE